MNLRGMRPILLAYGLPVLTVLAITFLMIVFKGIFNRVPFVFYFSAVLVSGWYGTLRSSLLATIISGLIANYFFFNYGMFDLDIGNLIPTFIFIIEGIAFSVIIQGHKRANKQANDALALRDEFIAVASHELKTPLTTIHAYGQLLSHWHKEKDSKKISHGLTIMNKEIGRLHNLIMELLDISKIRQGKMVLQKEQFDITGLLKEIVEQIQETTKTHKISFNGKAKRSVYADKYRIQQVIVNLMNNAIKYSPKSNKVLVKLIEDNKEAIISIQDYGIGIAQKHKQLIFDRYYRIRKDKAGMGLGLYVASQILEEHGEKLQVKSRLGKGSEFTFSLPLTSKPTRTRKN